MKKAFLLLTVLLISVLSTACINNFAVQELNNKAKEFMDKGDYSSAIERLKSSVDLDGNVFETRYNLAVAYTNAEDYPNAIKAYNEAVKLNPDFADLYYSLAVCEENLAKDIISKAVIVNDDETIEKAKDNDDETEKEAEDEDMSEVTKKVLISAINNSISDYQLYSDKSQNNDEEEVDNKIKELQELQEKYVK
ncbi:tetratricopeptide repeat protein [bacterium]|nr:tetratricopeptide repeat protein [bacterium]